MKKERFSDYLCVLAILFFAKFMLNNYHFLQLNQIQTIAMQWFVILLVFCAGLYINEPKK
jgi:hypothetical protein